MKIGFLQRVSVHKDAISLAVKVRGREDIAMKMKRVVMTNGEKKNTE